MAEYIEREVALKELNKNSITKKITLADGVSIFDTIKNIPTADVVEVVRCKDCEHSTLIFGTYVCDNIESPWYNDEFDIDVGANDFCSYGKRKEGAEE